MNHEAQNKSRGNPNVKMTQENNVKKLIIQRISYEIKRMKKQKHAYEASNNHVQISCDICVIFFLPRDICSN